MPSTSPSPYSSYSQLTATTTTATATATATATVTTTHRYRQCSCGTCIACSRQILTSHGAAEASMGELAQERDELREAIHRRQLAKIIRHGGPAAAGGHFF